MPEFARISVASNRVMNVACPDLFPGDSASMAEILKLARKYRHAAESLEEQSKDSDPALGKDRLASAPCRLCAIHAIELFLNTYLRFAGHKASFVRGKQHDLSAKLDLAMGAGLILKKKTEANLRALAVSKEYILVRYSPDRFDTLLQVNALLSAVRILDEKIGKHIEGVMPSSAR